MAKHDFTFNTTKYIPISPGCCELVYFCLPEEWKDKTSTGLAFLVATVNNNGRYLGGYQDADFENPRCQDKYQYHVTIDDSQFLVDPETELPYEITCEDLQEIFPYPCSLANIIDAILTLPDWVVDQDNVVTTVDPVERIFTIYYPIIDRVNGTDEGGFTVDLSALFDDTASDLSAYDTPTGGYTFTQAAILGGGTQVIQIISQDADNIVYAGSDNGVYLSCADVNSCVTIVSADADNILTAGSDGGAYASCDDVRDCIFTDATIKGDGSSGSPYGVDLSTDDGQSIIYGSDGKIFRMEDANDSAELAESNAVGPVAIDAVGLYPIFTGSILTLTNSSSARPQVAMVCGDNTLQVDFLTVGVWKFYVEESVDGGAFVLLASSQWGPLGADMAIPITSPVFMNYNIPAGGSITIQRRLSIETIVPSAVGSQVTSYALGMRALIVGV